MYDDFDSVFDAAIPCPSCGEEVVAKIRLLKTYTSIPCAYCRTVIDLTDPRHRALVDLFAEAVASVVPRFEDIVKKQR